MNATVRPRSWFRRILRFLLWTALILSILIVARSLYIFHNRAPGTDFALNLDYREARIPPRPLRVGFGRVKINPFLGDPCLHQIFREESHEKARAMGRQLASRIRSHLFQADVPATDHAPISIQARTVLLPLDNAAFLLASLLGLMERDHAQGMKIRSEVALREMAKPR